MRILLDVTRTLARRFNRTPTGIDRVELAFIKWTIDRAKKGEIEAFFIISAANMHAALTVSEIAKVIREVEDSWGKAGSNDMEYHELVSFLKRPTRRAPLEVGAARFKCGGAQRRTFSHPYFLIGKLLINGRNRFVRLMVHARKVETIYVHTGHDQVELKGLFGWLETHKIRSVFFVHDTIPLDYPEFCGQNSRLTHLKRMDTIATYASHIVVNSQYTKDRLAAYLPPEAGISITVSGLGTTIDQYEGRTVHPIKTATPYFVCLGTIEGRKNIAHLISVWRQIFSDVGPKATPRLLLVGKRGWECETIFDVLDRTAELAPYIAEVEGLKDVQLANLIEGAAALLAPSWVEGFSLPPVEAVCRGVPVIASDIPVHREILKDHALLLDPTDGIGWKNAILDLAWNPESRERSSQRAGQFPQKTWDSFVTDCFEGLPPRVQRPAPRARYEDLAMPHARAG
ncbi:glycosyltransferase family 4 protein [Rhizobium sp. CFBP 8762]|uniref:glycosyltransferase family 4 protein n=1 Tax=Rhizobium sp. CFBP 8762 TaxID=2775279 RepID=UPI001781C1B1|nr:glycosyltransferase family 1 protein [Rhizobium sp. CFBP 8762]MBD8554469.1 glycosyltransferase family 4 protein [Rhizobium sp. CFBP 8762]